MANPGSIASIFWVDDDLNSTVRRERALGHCCPVFPHAPSPPPFAVATPRGDAAGHGFVTLHSPPLLCAVVPGRCGDGGGCQVHQGAAVRPATCRHVRVPHIGPRVLRACVGAGVPLPPPMLDIHARPWCECACVCVVLCVCVVFCVCVLCVLCAVCVVCCVLSPDEPGAINEAQVQIACADVVIVNKQVRGARFGRGCPPSPPLFPSWQKELDCLIPRDWLHRLD